jgi:uracil-DNA glycosylase
MQPLTQTVGDWPPVGTGLVPMPHPSPRNNLWLRRNPWFEAEPVSALQQRVREVLAQTWPRVRRHPGRLSNVMP